MKKISFIQVWWLWSNSIFKLTLSFMIWWSQGHFKWKYESTDFNEPKEFDDPRYWIIPVIRWTLIIQSLRWYLHLLHQTCLWKPFYEQSPDPLFLPCRHQCLDWCTPKSQVRYLHASTCAKLKTCCSFHWTLIGNSESIHLFQKCLINPPATGLIVFLQTL